MADDAKFDDAAAATPAVGVTLGADSVFVCASIDNKQQPITFAQPTPSAPPMPGYGEGGLANDGSDPVATSLVQATPIQQAQDGEYQPAAPSTGTRNRFFSSQSVVAIAIVGFAVIVAGWLKYSHSVLLLSSESNLLDTHREWIELAGLKAASKIEDGRTRVSSTILRQIREGSLELYLAEDIGNHNVNRNCVTDFATLNEGYRELLKAAQDSTQKMRFFVHGLECTHIDAMLEYKMDTSDKKECARDNDVREKWFREAVRAHWVESRAVPSDTCFHDMSVQPQKCVTVADKTDWQRRKVQLSTREERIEEGKQLKAQLKQTPAIKSYPESCPWSHTFWTPQIPLWVLTGWPSMFLDDACWKKKYVAQTFPKFHIGLVGENGAGKTTLMSWIAHYSGMPADEIESRFGVCPSSAGSCTRYYECADITPTHAFHDTMGSKSTTTAPDMAHLINGRYAKCNTEMSEEFIKQKYKKEPVKWWKNLSIDVYVLFLVFVLLFSLMLMVSFLLSLRRTPYLWHSVDFRKLLLVLAITIVITLYGLVAYSKPTAATTSVLSTASVPSTAAERAEAEMHAVAYFKTFPTSDSEFDRIKDDVISLQKELTNDERRKFLLIITKLGACEQSEDIDYCEDVMTKKTGLPTSDLFMLKGERKGRTPSERVDVLNQRGWDLTFQEQQIIKRQTDGTFLSLKQVTEVVEKLQTRAKRYFQERANQAKQQAEKESLLFGEEHFGFTVVEFIGFAVRNQPSFAGGMTMWRIATNTGKAMGKAAYETFLSQLGVFLLWFVWSRFW